MAFELKLRNGSCDTGGFYREFYSKTDQTYGEHVAINVPDTEAKQDAGNDVKKEQNKDHSNIWILENQDLQIKTNQGEESNAKLRSSVGISW